MSKYIVNIVLLIGGVGFAVWALSVPQPLSAPGLAGHPVTELRSPIKGKIHQLIISSNTYVHIGEPLFKLSDPQLELECVRAELNLAEVRLRDAELQESLWLRRLQLKESEQLMTANAADARAVWRGERQWRLSLKKSLNRLREVIDLGSLAHKELIEIESQVARLKARSSALSLKMKTLSQTSLYQEHPTLQLQETSPQLEASSRLILSYERSLATLREHTANLTIKAPVSGIFSFESQYEGKVVLEGEMLGYISEPIGSVRGWAVDSQMIFMLKRGMKARVWIRSTHQPEGMWQTGVISAVESRITQLPYVLTAHLSAGQSSSRSALWGRLFIVQLTPSSPSKLVDSQKTLTAPSDLLMDIPIDAAVWITIEDEERL